MIDDEKVSFQQKLDFYDSTLHYYGNAKNVEMTREIAIKKMELSYKEGSYLETYRTGLHILNEHENAPHSPLTQTDSLQLNDIYFIMGRCCRSLELFDESAKYFYSIIKQPYNKYTIETYSYLGFLFTQMRQMEKSKNFNDIAIKMLSEADSVSVLKISSNVYNTLGGYYYTNDQLDSALYYLNLSVEYYDYSDNMLSKSFIYHNMAIIYQEMGENAMAMDFLRKAIEISENEPSSYAYSLQNLAYLLLENNNIAESEEYYFKALKVAQTVDNSRLESSILIEMSKLFLKKQQYKMAWEYLDKGVALRDSTFSSQNMEKITLLSQQFENYKISTEKSILEKELQLSLLANQKKSIILGILVSLLVILSVIAIIIVRRIHTGSIANMKKETEFTQDEIRKEYENTLEVQNRKLASNALYLVKTNEILMNLEKNIKLLSFAKDFDKQKHISDEMMSIIKSYNSGQTWNEFKLYFEQIHSDFYISINKINPNLSKMEQRLCALLVLNMSTKEIAQTTNRSVRTIETLIYRLRKNLEIPSDEKTINFLRKFLEK